MRGVLNKPGRRQLRALVTQSMTAESAAERKAADDEITECALTVPLFGIGSFWAIVNDQSRIVRASLSSGDTTPAHLTPRICLTPQSPTTRL